MKHDTAWSLEYGASLPLEMVRSGLSVDGTKEYLDEDTVVLDRLDFGFDTARRHGLACCICECPWARRYAGLGCDAVEYNTGVMFFTKRAQPIFDVWFERVRAIDSSIQFYQDSRLSVMPHNDQAALSFAVS